MSRGGSNRGDRGETDLTQRLAPRSPGVDPPRAQWLRQTRGPSTGCPTGNRPSTGVGTGVGCAKPSFCAIENIELARRKKCY